MKNNADETRKLILDSVGENLLISASAGCGKTTVMVERITKLLLEQKADIGNIMVVTFTNLAAAEMKRRIAKKLEENKHNPVAVKQLERLEDAAISTLHKFCIDILRNYFYVINVDPAFNVIDDIAASAYKKQALSEVLGEYSQSGDEVYSQLYQMFWTKRSENSFRATLLDLYDFSRCKVDFCAWWQNKRDNYLHFDKNNVLLDYLRKEGLLVFSEAQNDFSRLAFEATKAGEEKLKAKCEENAERCKVSARVSFESLHKFLLQTELEVLGRIPKIEALQYLYKQFDLTRKTFNDYADKYKKSFGTKSLKRLYAETASTVVYVDKIAEILTKFDYAFYQLKKQRGGLDFNDLEHLTLEVLRDENAAAEIKEKYKLIFVDEYQDTNGVQEEIIERLQQNDNLFMVGDAKQSIYGFRQSDPDLFLDKYDAYKSGRKKGKVYELHENFRSVKPVLDFANTVFSYGMTSYFGKVNYKRDALLTGNKTAVAGAPAVTVCLLEGQEETAEEMSSIYDLTEQNKDSQSMAQKEGKLVCSQIRYYLGKAVKTKDEEKIINYGDIVILVRGMVANVKEIYDTLVQNNIPVIATLKTESFACKEIRDLVNLLRVIDNPLNDVPLASVCLGFFGKMTEDELAKVALYSQKESNADFYSKLEKYVGEVKDGISGKIAALLDFVSEQRFLASSYTVEQLLLTILKKTGYHLYVQSLPNGVMRIRKLYALIDTIKGKSYCKSIDKFLSYVDDTQQERDSTLNVQTNAVRILTMHAAKGLEFPVVILCNTANRFKNEGGDCVVNKDTGIALDYCSFSAHTKALSLGKAVTAMLENKKQKEEELRLLYVALTRAKYFMCVICARKDSYAHLPIVKQPQRATCHSDWILSALKEKYGQFTDGELKDGILFRVFDGTQKTEETTTQDLLCKQDEEIEDIKESIAYVYPHTDAVKLPSKLMSSSLDKAYFDDEEVPQITIPLPVEDAAQVGTAYHKIFEKAQFNCTKEELSALIEKTLKDSGKTEKMNVDIIYNALHNEQLAKLMEGGKQYREIQFLLKTAYSNLDATQSDEQVTLQGVIDLLVLKEDEAIVLDYKYTRYPQNIKKNYSQQLRSYVLAVKSICKIEKVKAYVLSVANNELIEM